MKLLRNLITYLFVLFILFSCVITKDAENDKTNDGSSTTNSTLYDSQYPSTTIDTTTVTTNEDGTTVTTVPDVPKEYPYFAESFRNLFSHNTISEIEIQITQAEWDGLLSDMNDTLRTGNYRKANLSYKGLAGDEFVEDIGFRTRGNTTRIIPENPTGVYNRAHFKVKFNLPFGLTDGTTEYEERKERRFKKNRELNLKWNMNDDESQIRELYSYDFLNRVGVYTPKTGATRLYIKIGSNERKYFGVYTLIESVDKSFLKKRYGADGNDGNLYKCLWQNFGPATLQKNNCSNSDVGLNIGVKNWQTNYRPGYDRQTNDSDTNYSDLINFVNNINDKSGADLKSYLDANFEVGRFIKWVAANMLIGMPDDYWSMGNNYYLYFNNAGKIEFIPYDYDHGLGGGWDGGVGYDTIKNADIFDWFYHAPGSGYNDRPLMKILTIPEYKEQYVNALKTYINDGHFSLANFTEKFNQMKTIYQDYLDNDLDQGEYMALESYVTDYFNTKIQSVLDQIDEYENPSDPPDPPVIPTVTSPEDTTTDVIFRYYYTGSDPVVIRGSFNSWGYDTTNYSLTDDNSDDIYEITLPKTTVTSGSQYKFYYGTTADIGTWVTDPSNNQVNGTNSVVTY